MVQPNVGEYSFSFFSAKCKRPKFNSSPLKMMGLEHDPFLLLPGLFLDLLLLNFQVIQSDLYIPYLEVHLAFERVT